jgi:clan AA aspartic protease (TIGR02281 family)
MGWKKIPPGSRASKGVVMGLRTGKKWIWTVFVLIAVGAHTPLFAYQMEINGDKISIDANQIPLRGFLKQLSTVYGITVRIDPAINPLITVSFRNRDLEDGLKAILKPHNLVFVWKKKIPAVRDSRGPAYRLNEIHIFKPGHKELMADINEPPPPEEETSASEPGPVSETPVVIKDNRVLVPVVLGYDGREVETTLIFDTGAGSIVLHEDMARRLGIEQDQASQGEGEGVGGIRIATQPVHLAYVQVGPYRKENLRADIISYQGEPDDDYNGLLGMNFIRGLEYTIDFERQVIRWND